MKTMKKTIRLLLFLMIALTALSGCKKEETQPRGDEPVTENTAIRYNGQHSSYDEEAEKRRQEILALPDTVKPSADGITYYISPSGDDANDGKTPETAWRSSARIADSADSMIEGDVVLFERGGVYRGVFPLKSGVSYGAYGTGPKPCIYGSPQNYADKSLWEQTDEEHVWKISVTGMSDIGNIVFDHGEKCSTKKLEHKLSKDFDMFHDRETEVLYLYLSTGNPGEVYEDIEICSDQHLMRGAANSHDILIENLCLKYTGAHGISFSNGARRITVQGCEIGYIGGSMLSGQNVRYGNGFEVVDNCDTITAKDNWVYQCYDAGITHQSSFQPGCSQNNIVYSGNLIEYCNYNIEYYVSQENGRIDNTVYENNVLRFAGFGFGSVNRIGSNTSMCANICCYVRKMPVSNFVIRGNVMDSPLRFQTTIGRPNDAENLGPVIEGNTYIQQGDEVAVILSSGDAKINVWATDQTELEEAISRIDRAPASVTLE